MVSMMGSKRTVVLVVAVAVASALALARSGRGELRTSTIHANFR